MYLIKNPIEWHNYLCIKFEAFISLSVYLSMCLQYCYNVMN